jgi:hypothetical protein
METEAGVAASVKSITEGMAAMSLKEGREDNPLQRVRNAITDCMRGRLALRQRRRFGQSGYRPGASSKHFYRRISSKYGDNVIYWLDAAKGYQERGVHA